MLGAVSLTASSEGNDSVAVPGTLEPKEKALNIVSPSASVQLKVGFASKAVTVMLLHVAAFA